MASSSVDALFLGSIPLSSNEEVFTTLSGALGSNLKRIPDGETGGPRSNFIGCQYPVLPNPALQARWGGQTPDTDTLGTKVSDLNPLGYDDWALESYKTFESLQKDGKIAKETRFQVSLPSVFSVVQGFVNPKFCDEIEPLYEEKFLDAVHRIQAEIPHDKLSLQFDMPFEIAALEVDSGTISDPNWKAWFSNVKQGLIDRASRLIKAVDSDVPLGLHLCYGDIGHVHFVEPKDLGLAVDFINTISEAFESTHHIDYIHLPVPKSRTDAAYFEPLKGLKADSNTKIFFGVVHADDSEGSKARLDAAKAAYSGPIGIATECGLGRTPKEELDSIIAITKELTSAA